MGVVNPNNVHPAIDRKCAVSYWSLLVLACAGVIWFVISSALDTDDATSISIDESTPALPNLLFCPPLGAHTPATAKIRGGVPYYDVSYATGDDNEVRSADSTVVVRRLRDAANENLRDFVEQVTVAGPASKSENRELQRRDCVAILTNAAVEQWDEIELAFEFDLTPRGGHFGANLEAYATDTQLDSPAAFKKLVEGGSADVQPVYLPFDKYTTAILSRTQTKSYQDEAYADDGYQGSSSYQWSVSASDLKEFTYRSREVPAGGGSNPPHVMVLALSRDLIGTTVYDTPDPVSWLTIASNVKVWCLTALSLGFALCFTKAPTAEAMIPRWYKPGCRKLPCCDHMYGRTGGKAMDVMDQFKLRSCSLVELRKRATDGSLPLAERGGKLTEEQVQEILDNKQREVLLRHLLGSISDRMVEEGGVHDTARALELAGEFIPEMNQEMYSKTEMNTKAGSAIALGAAGAAAGVAAVSV